VPEDMNEITSQITNMIRSEKAKTDKGDYNPEEAKQPDSEPKKKKTYQERVEDYESIFKGGVKSYTITNKDKSKDGRFYVLKYAKKRIKLVMQGGAKRTEYDADLRTDTLKINKQEADKEGIKKFRKIMAKVFKAAYKLQSDMYEKKDEEKI
jgi:hypothetical protein